MHKPSQIQNVSIYRMSSYCYENYDYLNTSITSVKTQTLVITVSDQDEDFR